MNNTEIFINAYEKLNSENQCYILRYLRTLKSAQDIIDNHQCAPTKQQHVDLASIEKPTDQKIYCAY